VLHCALLPLNVLRLREVTGNIKAIRSLQSADGAPDFLIPYMGPVRCAAGWRGLPEREASGGRLPRIPRRDCILTIARSKCKYV
jgi:hypothetical protein